MNTFLSHNGVKIYQPTGESLFDENFKLPFKESSEKRMDLCEIFAEIDDYDNSLDAIFAS